MKNICYIVGVVVALSALGCEADKVGFLDCWHAMYVPDSTGFKSVLNPDDPEDARRVEFQIPYQSAGLQGVEGSGPIAYRILRIDCEPANREAAGQFYMSVVNGVIELPYDHTVPPGLYVFTIELSNENRKNVRILESCLKITVEDSGKQ